MRADGLDDDDTQYSEYDLAVLYSNLTPQQRRYIALRWNEQRRFFRDVPRAVRVLAVIVPVLLFLFWFGNLLRDRDIRHADSIVLDHLRDASVKNGNQALLPALREADEYYDDLTRNARAEYEDSKQ